MGFHRLLADGQAQAAPPVAAVALFEDVGPVSSTRNTTCSRRSRSDALMVMTPSWVWRLALITRLIKTCSSSSQLPHTSAQVPPERSRRLLFFRHMGVQMARTLSRSGPTSTVANWASLVLP